MDDKAQDTNWLNLNDIKILLNYDLVIFIKLEGYQYRYVVNL